MRHVFKLPDIAFLARTAASGVYSITSPTDIPDLYTWLDSENGPKDAAGDPITVDATAVQTWTDQSGSGITPFAAGAANRPTWTDTIVNGHAVVRFNGVNHYLYQTGATLAQPQTMFAVLKLNAVGIASKTLFGGKATNNWDINIEATYNNIGLWVGGGSTAPISQPTLDWLIIAVVWNGASTKYAVNTTTLTTSSIALIASSFGGLSVGSGWSGSPLQSMDVAEFIWYNGEKTSAQIVAMINYLSSKYAISLVEIPYGVKAYDTFESYGTNSELNGLNGGTGFNSSPWVDR